MPLSPLGRQQAIQIADDTHFLYSNYERVRAAFARHQYSFRNLYLQALRHKGLASHHGSLRMEKYQDAFSQFFDSDLLKVLRVDFSHTTVRPWIITICRERKNSHYPLYHILMAQFLYGGLEKLVERAEAALEALGFRDFRVRLFHGAARIQVTADQLPLALERREDLTAALQADFSDILLGLAPRAPST